MSEDEQIDVMVSVVAMVANDLTDGELRALNLCAQFDTNPRGRVFDYEKVAPLFTEANGTRMERAAKEALARVVAERFGGAR